MSSEPLAHSARDRKPVQLYRDHISGVLARSREHARDMACTQGAVGATVESAASFHDLGKLDVDNQRVLRGKNPRRKLPINHCDGGTAYLWRQGKIDAATLVYSHHLGLFSYPEEVKKGNSLFLRDPQVAERTNQKLDGYLEEHEHVVNGRCDRVEKTASSWSGLTRRIGLSCLVDADWGDTATHFGNERDRKAPTPRWTERLESLNRHINSMPEGETANERERNRLRARLYAACRDADTRLSIRQCAAPVGTGKTTAIMAHLLRVASDHNLRRIFVVLPYTNIIKQAVETYRKVLVLPGENAEEVVAEHHHRADFKDFDLRGMSELWMAPIVVTTAVQFFETLGNHLPAQLRKLHRIPRSAVFVDEAHAAMPAWLWPQQWLWLQELVDFWGCHTVLASGSLVRFWENSVFLKGQTPREVPSVIGTDLGIELAAQEKSRVSLPARGTPMNRHELIDVFLSKPGPRLIIMNTVQSAAVIAHEMLEKGCDIIHLSTALAPVDRDPIINKVIDRLASGQPAEWTLVATSCVEAGMDFDFRTAFRESASVCSLLQTSGRVNRHGRRMDCEVLDFRTNDRLLNQHPAFERSRYVLDQMYEDGHLSHMQPDEAASEAFRREIETSVANAKAGDLLKAERDMDYPKVGMLNRVIDADTRLVLVNAEIVKAIKNRESLSSRDILMNSVQLWSKKIEALGLEPVDEGREVYHLGSHKYDPSFLGYMEGLLPLVYATEQGLIV